MFGRLFRRAKRVAGPETVVRRDVLKAEVTVSPGSRGVDSSNAQELAHQLEQELRHELDGVHDAGEIKVALARFEREHGLRVLTDESQRFRIQASGTRVDAREVEEELRRELAGVDDPEAVRAAMKRLAEKHGWSFEADEASSGT